MRREDAHYRFCARQLHAFHAVSIQATWGWLAKCMGDPANMILDEGGYRTYIPSQVIEQIARCDKVKRLSTSGPDQNPVISHDLLCLNCQMMIRSPPHSITRSWQNMLSGGNANGGVSIWMLPTFHLGVASPPTPLTTPLVQLIITLIKSESNEHA